MASWHPKRVGGFVLAGVALLVVAVILVGSGSLFSKKHTFVSYFTGSVAGLRVGAPVKLRGITIGQVTGVYLTLSHQVDLTRVPVIYEIDERLVRQRGAEGARLGDRANATWSWISIRTARWSSRRSRTRTIRRSRRSRPAGSNET